MIRCGYFIRREIVHILLWKINGYFIFLKWDQWSLYILFKRSMVTSCIVTDDCYNVTSDVICC